VPTRPDTYLTADTSGSVFDFDMTVPKEINFAEHLFGADVKAIPTSRAVV